MVMAEPVKPSPLRIGDYEIIRTIGKGNFAVVKLARHQITHTEVAIKIIEKTRLDQSNLKKIYREIQILKLLRHQHIIKLYQVIETKSTIYLVCEYASHGELFDYITQEEKIPEDKARKMFHQVLTAIEYCHKNNVVHRDLKAENLLLDANDNVKLADFGFGNFFQSGQNLNTWCGSPPYAAPEVFEGKLYEGPQLDVWSLGIVLYVLVCGTFPFDGSNLATLKERVLAGRFRIPYWMSQDCENLIRRMLVVNPKKRLTIAQIKKHKWMQVFSVKPETVLRTSDSPVRRAGSNQLPEFNEHILKLIQGLGIDRQQTIESLRKSAYDQFYAIYHLLVDRLKHHRTSFPLESRFCYDGGKRRPSNVADQTVTKHFASNPISVSRETKRSIHRNPFFAHQQNISPITSERSINSPASDVNQSEVNQRINMQFPENMPNDLSLIHRTLRLNQMHIQHMSQPPMSPPPTRKSKFVTHPGRGSLPHQPFSFNAGIGGRNVYQRHPNHQVVTQYRGSGDVIPSVTSIDEGVELVSASPSEQEMIKHIASQQRRHTLELPDASSVAPFVHLHGRGDPFSRSPIASVTSQADSLVGSMNSAIASHEPESVSDSVEMSFDDNHVHSRTSETTPKLVLSPCIDESTEVPPPPEDRSTYIDNQRQLLDVSPTGFREGRRASDGLLLLGDGRLGEHLKRLTRTNGFATINQEDADDSCFDATEQELNNRSNNATQNNFNTVFKESHFGTMTSHSSHHVMQTSRGDVINYQPYESTHRRRSLHVWQDSTEGRSGPYLKETLGTSLQQQSIISPLLVSQEQSQSYDVIENDQRYEWSSWKPVSDNEASSVHGTSNHRRDLMHRTNVTAFVVASDESMTRSSVCEQTKRKPSLPITPLNHQLIGQQSLVQQLQQRRLSRRLKVAQNNMQTVPSYPLPLPELEQLNINVDFGCGGFSADKYAMSSSNEELSVRQFQQSAIQHHDVSDMYRGDSLDLQQTVQRNSIDLQQQSATISDQQHNLGSWNNSNDSFQENTAMEFLFS